ncbi:hypothetical protein B0H15DRAFT_824789 [Mycena belliarum]|uniref:Uncharacterized protein n=1 Tax=Mycena belliarum TaxID=1033014 RepID=A0AAD6UAC0_9AGAR|nr:hypothetical protein B0H15DRAFT_824789 [Mycena belliae]
MLQIMPRFDTFCILCACISALAGYSQATDVTLWQFGRGRLLGASITLPLQPLGTALNGAATTYLYRALNGEAVNTTNSAGSQTVSTVLVTGTRIIVASASGWIEQPTPTLQIDCHLIRSDFGECLDNGAPANSGKPTPEVLQVLAETPAFSSSSGSPPITSPPTTLSSAPSQKSSNAADGGKTPSTVPVGTIIGAAVGGVTMVLSATILLLWCRRRRIHRENSRAPTSYPAAAPLYPVIAPASILPSEKVRSFSQQDSTRSSPITSRDEAVQHRKARFNTQQRTGSGRPGQPPPAYV